MAQGRGRGRIVQLQAARQRERRARCRRDSEAKSSAPAEHCESRSEAQSFKADRCSPTARLPVSGIEIVHQFTQGYREERLVDEEESEEAQVGSTAP